jgi:hypothetical protein
MLSLLTIVILAGLALISLGEAYKAGLKHRENMKALELEIEKEKTKFLDKDL